MKYIIEYYFILARFIYYKIKRKADYIVIGRVFEGIAIGIYANTIGRFVDDGIGLNLTANLIIAIILTYAAISLQKKER